MAYRSVKMLATRRSEFSRQVLYYQKCNWRANFVFKASSSKSVRRLLLEEVPGSALAQRGFRTGRKITIATRRSEDHETRSLHLFAPLWILNDKTDLNMLIKVSDKRDLKVF